MAAAEFRDTLTVGKDRLLEAITRHEDYPKFVEGCKSVDVSRGADGKVRVVYHVEVMSQDVTYVLDHVENQAAGTVEWELVESNFFKKNKGRWVVRPEGPEGSDQSDVLYALEVEFKIPVPSFILNRLVKGSLPAMVKSFEKQAKQVSKVGKARS